MWAKVLTQVLIELSKGLGSFLIKLFKNKGLKGKQDEIAKLAKKRKDLLRRMEEARIKRDFVLYDALFDEYSQLQSSADS